MDLNRLGRGVWGNAFSRLFELDELNSVGTLAPEIMPVVSLAERPEYWVLHGGRRGIGGHNVTPVGGNLSTVRLSNAAASQTLGIVDSTFISLVGAGGCAMQLQSIGDLQASTTRAKSHTDPRPMIPVSGSANLGGGLELVVSGGDLFNAFAGGHGTYQIMTAPHVCEVPWIIPPGFALAVIGLVIAQNLGVTFSWRERPVSNQEVRM